MASTEGRIVQVGIIGCGEITQVAHIPTLGFLSHRFQVTYLCDVSQGALNHCQAKVIGPRPKITVDVEELCASDDVDVVIIANSDAFHVPHTMIGLKYNKFVFVEKPMALSLKDADLIIEAEKKSAGKVMIGYMRRYATAFLDAVKEIGSLEKINYARVRDIVGPNSTFVGQSGTFPRSFQDHRQSDIENLSYKTNDFIQQALCEELKIPNTPDLALMWRHLGSLGSHDLSAMREALGMPTSVLGASLCKSTGSPFWSALFQYPSFTVAYESGIDLVPRFDASIEVFGDTKTIKIVYDSPYVKGLPVTMQIKEALPDGSYRESTVRRTYEDPYTIEMNEIYACFMDGKEIKTTAADAKRDVELFGMIMHAGVGVNKA
ncbi:Oxidoreductase N-terminal [Penicillium taxi]|uniref:Oxidoreductase N-terminal n=1 Tax=Penicillium taxi TaxID=168475 RepID=UPI002544E558|nr:Oxidoreductase N-terminal [Penicillium taxi]KAJ5901959.1 Oxidoreductase N-terminal [Penicillium taxi]